MSIGIREVLLVCNQPVPPGIETPGVRATKTESVSAARRALEARRFDLVVAALDLADGSGLELVAAVDERNRVRPREATKIALFVDSAQRLGQHSELATRWTFERPQDLGDVIATALERATQTPPTLRDYCTLAIAGQRPILVEIWKGSSRAGAMSIRGNQVWRAEDDKGFGPEAFLRLCALDDARLTCSALVSDREMRLVSTSVEVMLGRSLEARSPKPVVVSDGVPVGFVGGVTHSRRFDGRAEVPRGRTLKGLSDVVAAVRAREEGLAPATAAAAPITENVPPPPSSRARIVPRETFEELLERSLDLILEKRYAEAFDVLERADDLRPGDPKVTTNLARLRALGHG